MVSYWMPPNTQFLPSTGCRPTGRNVSFFQLPQNEWRCPDHYPQLPRGPYNNYAWWTGRGLGSDREFGHTFDPVTGERKTMYWAPQEYIEQDITRLRESGALQRLREEDEASRRALHQRILQYTPQQQAEIRRLLDEGRVVNIHAAIREVTGDPRLTREQIEVFVNNGDVENGGGPGRFLPFVLVGGAVLLLGGSLIYYFKEK